MPQMAPMMWQTIYFSCIMLVMLTAAKNFFSIIKKKNASQKINFNYNEKGWKW